MNHENDRSEGGARLLISVKSLPSVVSLWGSLGPESFEAEQSWLLNCHERTVNRPDMIYELFTMTTTHLRDPVIFCQTQVILMLKQSVRRLRGKHDLCLIQSVSTHAQFDLVLRSSFKINKYKKKKQKKKHLNKSGHKQFFHCQEWMMHLWHIKRGVIF